jgi:hypothetical protein
MDQELEYLVPLLAELDETIDQLDVLLIALAVTSPAPFCFALEQSVMHCATVLRHARSHL